MINLSITVRNLPELRANFARAPQTALKYLARAVQAAVFEVEKEAVDKNFRFKTPRAKRSGFLALSFSYGRYFSPSKLMASIGPTAHYAPYVYFGTSRGIKPNSFMDRIAKAAEPNITKHFEKAVDLFVSDLAKL